MSSYQAHVIKDLPSPIGEANFSKELLKKLTYMDWYELSHWVQTVSGGKYFLSRPRQANDIDLEVCVELSAQRIIVNILKSSTSRKNGRELKIIKAIKNKNSSLVASALASAVRSYWQDHGFYSTSNSKLNRGLALQDKNLNNLDIKTNLQSLQLSKIGVIIEAKKANKKGAIQICLDFDETEKVLKNFNFEDEQ